ncbi:MAG: deoxyguanosinetriphosphate triphosphohydrolase family protein [Desulfurivibrionaceae bacterium]
MVFQDDPHLIELRELLDSNEDRTLSPLATRSRASLRRHSEKKTGHRQSFSVDTDRILNSRAYTRYIDKTQVFYMVANDHITHRVLHVQLVSKIARTIGRFMGLNEDLIEAIALGHDIGHPPFGHDGEKLLSRLCEEQGLPPFHHNIQSALYLDRIEREGRGWNLTLQTLDGILFHDGEVHCEELHPFRARDFAGFDAALDQRADNLPIEQTMPMTLEGCLVRFCDTIGYIGRDIEDAIELNLISREELPPECTEVLGNTNGTMVYRLVVDLIKNGCTEDRIFFSPDIAETLRKLKKFNYERIYLNSVIKRGFDDIENCYRTLFRSYLDDLRDERRRSVIFIEFLDRMDSHYLEANPPAAMVRDFIAGMTDDYFMAQAALAGCRVPVKQVGPLVD